MTDAADAMPAEPLVSVIIPTYNRAAFIVDAVESVLVQSYRSFEIIVVDDGSQDATRDLLQPYLDRISYVYQDNRGRSAARNTGLRQTVGEYVVFLDSDDLLLPGKLEVQVRFLEERPCVDIVYGDGYCLAEDGSLGPLEPHVTSLPALADVDMTARMLHINLFALHTAMLRRRVLKVDEPFDESLHALEDWDLWIRLLLKGATLCYDEKKVAIYRMHDGNTERVTASLSPMQVHICSKVVDQRLDAQLPPRIRQDFRLDHLGMILRSRSAVTIRDSLGTIVWPDGHLSAYGVVALMRRILALSQITIARTGSHAQHM